MNSTPRALSDDRALLDSLSVVSRDDSTGVLSAGQVIAVGYAERLRLGLGSPFRLLEHAWFDRRMDAVLRQQVARGLLQRTVEGDGYELDATAIFDAALRPGASRFDTTAAYAAEHARIVDDAFVTARDPRAGELAVRIGYIAAALERLVSTEVMRTATLVAALGRDRVLAAVDARRVIDAAARAGEDPAVLAISWRASRRFDVERPPLATPPATFEPEGVSLARRVYAALRELYASRADTNEAPSDSVADELVGPVQVEGAPVSSISLPTAVRLSRLSSSAPPLSGIIVSLDAIRSTILYSAGASGWPARERFLNRALNEESLVSEFAIASLGSERVAEMTLGVLGAAVALRAHAQDVVTTDDSGSVLAPEKIGERLDIARVSFDASVPAAWRSHYVATLERSLADARRILPALDLNELRIRFAPTPIGKSALAMHDPTSRTIFLPLRTGSGTLAHELAHDLDWLSIRRGSYRTDEAIRHGERRLALALRRLVPDSLIPPAPENQGDLRAYSRRPTEVFAREVDRFVATSLALEGLSNGHLTSVQDDLITGYAGVAPHDISGTSGTPIVELVSSMTRIAPDARAAYIARYGPWRQLTALDRVRLVGEVPSPSPREVTPPPSPLRVALPEVSPTLLFARECVATGGERQNWSVRAAVERSRVDAATLAAEARARAIVGEWRERRPMPLESTESRAAQVALVRDTLLSRAARASIVGTLLEHVTVRSDCAGERHAVSRAIAKNQMERLAR